MTQPILLIEDNENNRYLATFLLQGRGFEVGHAADGPCGLALAAQCQPALILLDIQLPGMDGYAVARSGLRVTCFNDGHQALASVRANRREFDLVITDHNMPGLSGIEVARELRSIRADLPVILGTGYVDDDLRANAASAGVVELLHKERLAEDLLPLVRRVLAAAQPALPPVGTGDDQKQR